MPQQRQSIPAEPDPDLIDRTIASGFHQLLFPRPLEDRFEHDVGDERTRQLIARGLLGLVLFNIFLASDWRLMPDVFATAFALRLLVITPLALAGLWLIWRNRIPAFREGMIAGMLVVISTVPPILILTSESPLRDAGHHGMILVVLFGAMIARVRFWFLLPAVLIIHAMYAATTLGLQGVSPEKTLSFNMVFAGAVMFTLIGSYALEREQRLAYLLGLREAAKNRELESISRHDPLTGLGNRRALEAELRGLSSDEPTGENVAVLLLDIDHFKAYNDSLAHQAGDVCLRRVASLILGELRDRGDLAFRYGGEEFLVLLRHADLSLALTIGERLRAAIERTGIPHPEARGGILTGSLGVASTQLGNGISTDELISSADAALYAAKRAGRNQVWPRSRQPVLTTIKSTAAGR
jgi:diguanylate cyclase (GGDEF)-like protein